MALISFPWNAFEPYAVAAHAAINEDDRDLIDDVERAGFKVDGKGGPGMFYMYLRKGGVSIQLEYLLSEFGITLHRVIISTSAARL